MRHALNNLQATHTGFEYISAENVFKVSFRVCMFALTRVKCD